jgi:hypothetical protein
MKPAALRKLAAVAVLAAALSSSGSALAQPRAGQRTATADAGPAAPQAPTAVLWDQMDTPDPDDGYITSSNFRTGFDNIDSVAADDFLISGEFWTITSVTASGLYIDGLDASLVESVLIQIYADSGFALPGTLLRSETIPGGNIAGLNTGLFVMNLGSPLLLGPGHYWLAVQANKTDTSFKQWVWLESFTLVLDESVWKQPGNGYGTGCIDWAKRITVCDRPHDSVNPDLVFRIEGTSIDIAASIFLPNNFR